MLGIHDRSRKPHTDNLTSSKLSLSLYIYIHIYVYVNIHYVYIYIICTCYMLYRYSADKIRTTQT